MSKHPKHKPEDNLYWCRACEAYKPGEDFYRTPDGTMCMPCRACKKEWREQNKEHLRQYLYDWREKEADKYKAVCARHRAKFLPRKLIRNREREIHENRARPKWADREKIDAIYALAKTVTELSGVPHHVDHEIPLHGKLVSGLHVETNLRVIQATDNLKKFNKFVEA